MRIGQKAGMREHMLKEYSLEVMSKLWTRKALMPCHNIPNHRIMVICLWMSVKAAAILLEGRIANWVRTRINLEKSWGMLVSSFKNHNGTYDYWFD